MPSNSPLQYTTPFSSSDDLPDDPNFVNKALKQLQSNEAGCIGNSRQASIVPSLPHLWTTINSGFAPYRMFNKPRRTIKVIIDAEIPPTEPAPLFSVHGISGLSEFL